MNRLITLISLVLGVSLVFLAGSSFAQGSGYQPMGWHPVEARWLIGQRVNGPTSNYIGQITDLVIDQANDRVALVVLSGIPGLGDKEVAIPYGCIERTDEYTFETRFPNTMGIASANNNMDSDLYFLTQTAKGSERYGVPHPINPNWIADVYTYYGQVPYWAEKGKDPWWLWTSTRAAN